MLWASGDLCVTHNRMSLTCGLSMSKSGYPFSASIFSICKMNIMVLFFHCKLL